MVMGRTSAPASRTDVSTRSRASGSIKSTTQPPPPAPQTLPASAPLRRALSTAPAHVLVLAVGKILFGAGRGAVVAPVDLAFPCSGKAVGSGENGHRHGAGAADACARRSLRIGGEREASLRPEELGDFREEGKSIALGLPERGK